MRHKLDRRSYLIGVLAGALIGIGGGYLGALVQGMHRASAAVRSEVVVSIAALRKLEKNDLESTSRLLRIIIANDYLEHADMTGSWWMRTVYYNSELISDVELAADELPSLKKTIEEQRTKRIQRQNKMLR